MDNLTQEQLLLHPMYLLSQEIKQKSLKKYALENISIIALALDQQRTRAQLIPYLSKLFLKQTQQYKIIILKSLTTILPYIGKPHHGCIILQIILDVLCVYPQIPIRNQAFICLQKVLSFMDIRKAAKALISTLQILNEQKDQKIRQLILKIIPYIYIGVDNDNEEELLVLLRSFKESQTDKILLSRQLKQLIKVMPPAPETQIKSIIELLLNMPNPIAKINLIEPIILLTKLLGQQITTPYLKNIMQDTNTQVICALVKRMKDLTQQFSPINLQPIQIRIRTFRNQNQDIKNSLLQVLQYLTLNQNQKIQLYSPPDSLQLRNTLGETLCRINDMISLKKIIQNSDIDFKIKIFPKLPQINQLHLQLFQQIFMGKNWRIKGNIFINLQKRLDNNQNIQLFFPKLYQYLGDKISTIRIGAINLISKIINKKNIQFITYQKQLIQTLKSDNWFQRQSAYMLIKNILKDNNLIRQYELQKLYKIVKSQQQSIVNIKTIIIEIQDIFQQKYKYQLKFNR